MKKFTMLFAGLIVMSIMTTSCNRKGCTDADAANYEEKAKKDDSSCYYDRDDIIGSYSMLENCNDEGNWSYTLTITEELDKTKINIENLGGWDDEVTVEATVDGDDFSFSQTVNGRLFSGSGTVTSGTDLTTISLDYSYTEGAVVKGCDASGSKI